MSSDSESDYSNEGQVESLNERLSRLEQYRRQCQAEVKEAVKEAVAETVAKTVAETVSDRKITKQQSNHSVETCLNIEGAGLQPIEGIVKKSKSRVTQKKYHRAVSPDGCGDDISDQIMSYYSKFTKPKEDGIPPRLQRVISQREHYEQRRHKHRDDVDDESRDDVDDDSSHSDSRDKHVSKTGHKQRVNDQKGDGESSGESEDDIDDMAAKKCYKSFPDPNHFQRLHQTV